jgi:hypothetical protein
LQMCLDGLCSEMELSCNFLIAQSLCQQGKGSFFKKQPYRKTCADLTCRDCGELPGSVNSGLTPVFRGSREFQLHSCPGSLDALRDWAERKGSSIFPEFLTSPYELISDVLFLFQ